MESQLKTFALLSAVTSMPFGNRFIVETPSFFLELSFNCYCRIIEADNWNLPWNHFWTDTATLQFGKACLFNSSILCKGNDCSQGIHEKQLLLQYPLDFCWSSWDCYWKIVTVHMCSSKITRQVTEQKQHCWKIGGRNDVKLSSQAFKRWSKWRNT